MWDCTSLTHILENIVRSERFSTVKIQDRDSQCTNSSIKSAEKALKTFSSSLNHCSDSSINQITDFEADSWSFLHTSLSSTSLTFSVFSTEELVALTEQYHLSQSLLIVKLNSNSQHQFLSCVKKWPQDSFAEGLTSNANMFTSEINSLSLNKDDQHLHKKQKKLCVNTVIWDSHYLCFEQIFAENLHMLNELLNNFFLQHVFEAFNIDSNLIHFIECHFKNTVSQQTINLSVTVYLLTKNW